jgi:LysM repeat protein
LLDFFRKNSALLAVALITSVIVTGNFNVSRDNEGLILGYFTEEVDNKEKILSRVKSHTVRNHDNLLMSPLAMASSLSDDESIEITMLSEEEMKINQLQHQVLTASTPPDAEKLLDDGADVAVYLVEEGDSVSSIAQKFGITVNTILWANDIENASLIQPGDKIFILPVAGLKHVVKSGDTVEKIAKDYKADEQEIIEFNNLPANGKVKEGEELIIPGGKKEEPASLFQERDYYSSGVADSGRTPSIIDRNPKGGHVFPYGYCTWYVAQHKYVPWGGNAGTWLYNARAYGAKTGKTPKVGSIIVTSESWYGHVGIVEKVHSNGNITISEMNYKGFAVTNKRTLSSKSRVIKGYIY